MLEAIDLSKRYHDGTLVLDALNLEVAPGEIYCLLGAPGAGKTTVIHLFLNLTRPTSGRAMVDGVEAARAPLEARQRLVYVMGGAVLYDDLTALQNLNFLVRLSGCKASRDELAAALREVALPEKTFRQRLRDFDPGMRQKVVLAAAFARDVPALVLDEPTSGLDPQVSAEIVEILDTLRERGKAILLATQDLLQAKQIADRVAVLKEGRKVLAFTREELRFQDLERLYLDYMRGGIGVERPGPGAGR